MQWLPLLSWGLWLASGDGGGSMFACQCSCGSAEYTIDEKRHLAVYKNKSIQTVFDPQPIFIDSPEHLAKILRDGSIPLAKVGAFKAANQGVELLELFSTTVISAGPDLDHEEKRILMQLLDTPEKAEKYWGVLKGFIAATDGNLRNSMDNYERQYGRLTNESLIQKSEPEVSVFVLPKDALSAFSARIVCVEQCRDSILQMPTSLQRIFPHKEFGLLKRPDDPPNEGAILSLERPQWGLVRPQLPELPDFIQDPAWQQSMKDKWLQLFERAKRFDPATGRSDFSSKEGGDLVTALNLNLTLDCAMIREDFEKRVPSVFTWKSLQKDWNVWQDEKQYFLPSEWNASLSRVVSHRSTGAIRIHTHPPTPGNAPPIGGLLQVPQAVHTPNRGIIRKRAEGMSSFLQVPALLKSSNYTLRLCRKIAHPSKNEAQKRPSWFEHAELMRKRLQVHPRGRRRFSLALETLQMMLLGVMPRAPVFEGASFIQRPTPTRGLGSWVAASGIRAHKPVPQNAIEKPLVNAPRPERPLYTSETPTQTSYGAQIPVVLSSSERMDAHAVIDKKLRENYQIVKWPAKLADILIHRVSPIYRFRVASELEKDLKTVKVGPLFTGNVGKTTTTNKVEETDIEFLNVMINKNEQRHMEDEMKYLVAEKWFKPSLAEVEAGLKAAVKNTNFKSPDGKVLTQKPHHLSLIKNVEFEYHGALFLTAFTHNMDGKLFLGSHLLFVVDVVSSLVRYIDGDSTPFNTPPKLSVVAYLAPDDTLRFLYNRTTKHFREDLKAYHPDLYGSIFEDIGVKFGGMAKKGEILERNSCAIPREGIVEHFSTKRAAKVYQWKEGVTGGRLEYADVTVATDAATAINGQLMAKCYGRVLPSAVISEVSTANTTGDDFTPPALRQKESSKQPQMYLCADLPSAGQYHLTPIPSP